MAQKKFDLTTTTKEQVFGSGKAFLLGGTVVLIASYDATHAEFAARFGDVLMGGLCAFGLSLGWSGLSAVAEGIADGKRDRYSEEKPFSRRERHLRRLPVNTAAGTRQVSVPRTFEYQQPGYIVRETWLGAAKRVVLGRTDSPRIIERPTIVKPPEVDEYKFISQGVQLLESDVLRFLDNAWRNRSKGRGLSERRWCGKNGETLPAWFKGESWYWAFLHLLANAEDATGVQTVIVKGNGWKLLAHPPRAVYALLRYTECLKS